MTMQISGVFFNRTESFHLSILRVSEMEFLLSQTKLLLAQTKLLLAQTKWAGQI